MNGKLSDEAIFQVGRQQRSAEAIDTAIVVDQSYRPTNLHLMITKGKQAYHGQQPDVAPDVQSIISYIRGHIMLHTCFISDAMCATKRIILLDTLICRIHLDSVYRSSAGSLAMSQRLVVEPPLEHVKSRDRLILRYLKHVKHRSSATFARGETLRQSRRTM